MPLFVIRILRFNTMHIKMRSHASNLKANPFSFLNSAYGLPSLEFSAKLHKTGFFKAIRVCAKKDGKETSVSVL
jgi:hypothetical protein